MAAKPLGARVSVTPNPLVAKPLGPAVLNPSRLWSWRMAARSAPDHAFGGDRRGWHLDAQHAHRDSALLPDRRSSFRRDGWVYLDSAAVPARAAEVAAQGAYGRPPPVRVEPDVSNHLRRRPGVAMVVGLRCGAGGRTVEPRRWGSPPTAVDADGLYLARMRVTAWPSLRSAAPSRDT